MSVETIERDFKAKVSDRIRLMSEGVDRYQVFTPFVFDDGDHLVIVLKRQNSHWVLSDEGHTYMHLTYKMDEKDLQRGTRQNIITNALSMFDVSDRGGELAVDVKDDRYGDALYSFVQALLKITDVTYLSRERVKSTFMEDFRAFMEANVPENRRTFDWHDPQHDPEGKYLVDCRINQMARPILCKHFRMTTRFGAPRLPCFSSKSGESRFARWRFSRIRRKLTARSSLDSAMFARNNSPVFPATKIA